nr:nucleotide-binding alpha-beta plait domain-containing protein [Tanacetum cinerariifolium]
MSGSQRSKKDDVQKISTSVFVTNFPGGYCVRDLCNTCKLYGHVVDVFIPDRRTKAGKRFGFVRFIKVLDIDRVINNLCMVWVGHNKIHANVARFQREPLHKQSNNVNNKGMNNFNHGAMGMTNSYVHVVKGNQVQNVGMEECPNMLLDETCLNYEDFLFCLQGKVKEFASLTNLKVVLGKEGYVNIKLKYMGGFWVMIVFQDDETKKRRKGLWCSRNTFSCIASRWGTLLNGEELEDEGYHSNRICIRTKLKTVVFDSFKMVYRGMTCWVRAIEVPDWVPDFEEDGEEGYYVNDGSHEDDMYWGVSKNLKDVEGESDREEVPKTNFEEEPDKSIFEGNSVRNNDVHSEDPFGIYEVLNKKRDGKNIDDKHEDSLKYPPGERFGSIFNKHGAEAFNSFIVNAGLVEVPLGGCSFTWCHKSAKKMSKLDRFLIFDNLMCSCRSISSTSLDRFLLDHWPIIMHDADYDYGPIPFKFFHYCFELDGFDKLIEQTWLEANVNDQNSYRLDADGHRRREVVRLIQEVENVDAMKVTQKAKIKWSIEGDKKSKYYHGDRGIDKAPGSDGFTFGFYRRYWDISDILVLLGVCIKLLLRFWHRLVTVLDDIIDEIQSTFVTDRQMLDGPFILNEIVHCCKNKKKQSMIFKVDFEKADNIDTIIRVLDVFYRTSSLSINLNKSNLMGIFVDSNKVKHAVVKKDVNSKKLSWVRWKSVLATKDVGGLGVSSLFA